jgi:transcriptional regulator with XRE-family HTH domain
MKIEDLLDRAKKSANIESDYALAKVLGISPGNLSNIRTGKSHPSNEVAVKLATLAKIEEMQVIASIEYRTANTEKKKKFWKSYLESRGLVATIGMIGLGLSIMTSPEPAEANVLHIDNYGETITLISSQDIHYAYYKDMECAVLRLFSINCWK